MGFPQGDWPGGGKASSNQDAQRALSVRRERLRWNQRVVDVFPYSLIETLSVHFDFLSLLLHVVDIVRKRNTRVVSCLTD